MVISKCCQVSNLCVHLWVGEDLDELGKLIQVQLAVAARGALRRRCRRLVPLPRPAPRALAL